MNILELKRVGQFMGVQEDKTLTFGERNFRIILYGAYNAHGLIGPECNGIAVLDEDNKCVVLDEEAKQDTGYYGASERQKQRFKEVIEMTWDVFKTWVAEHPRAREAI
jgi:hypothetical protein